MGNIASAHPWAVVKPILRERRASKTTYEPWKPHFKSFPIFDENIIFKHTMGNRSKYSPSKILHFSRMSARVSSLTAKKWNDLLYSGKLTPHKAMQMNRYSVSNAFNPPSDWFAHNTDGPARAFLRACTRWVKNKFGRKVRFSDNVRVHILDE